MLRMLEIGDKIDIRSMKAVPEGTKRKTYLSQIIDISGSIQIKITMPTLGTTVVPLEQGWHYECTFYTEKGLFQGEFVVGERYREGNLPVLSMELCTPLKKVQRREFYRYDCTLPMKYRYARENEKIAREQMSDLEWRDGVVLDLSGGGMRFVVSESIEKGSLLQINLVLEIQEEYRPFYIYGEVISSRVRSNNVRLRECRVQFVRMSEPERDQIIGYIFAQERKRLSSNGE